MGQVDLCPHCHQNAPIVYRGLIAYCTACGAMRGPLASPSVNLAGQTSKVGGTVAKVFGWLILAGGVLVAAMIVAMLQAIFAGGIAGWIVGIPVGLISIVVGVLLLVSGRSLSKTGQATEKETRLQAVYALAANRGGVLSAIDVARALNLSLPEGDAILTALAKEHPDQVSVDLDDQGGVFFRFPNIQYGGLPKMRVEEAGPYGTQSRVEEPAEPVEVEREAPLPGSSQSR